MNTTVARSSFSAAELARVSWRISTRSANHGGNCVEAGPVADGSGRVALRHSHHPSGHVIACSHSEWATFTAGVKNGAFDFGARPGLA